MKERLLPAGGEFECGVNFGFYAREGWYGSAEAHEEVDEMARTGRVVKMDHTL